MKGVGPKQNGFGLTSLSTDKPLLWWLLLFFLTSAISNIKKSQNSQFLN